MVGFPLFFLILHHKTKKKLKIELTNSLTHMKYFVIDFKIDAPAELLDDARDVLSALAGEAGFETFEETETGLKGYVQQALFSRDVLDAMLASFPFEGIAISYDVAEVEDRDWNEQWEQEGFEPIVVAHRCVIHDGRHLADIDLAQWPLAIEIDAHLAFGTGTHETTRMMVGALMQLSLGGCRVLDCGCGTGILGIVALKCGAREAVGYDIDEWSADNARHNAVINGVNLHYTALLGDASVLNAVEGVFQVVLANINRNILLADLPAFCRKLDVDGHVLLSGFYAEDVPLLKEKASQLGLQAVAQHQDGDWACLVLHRS